MNIESELKLSLKRHNILHKMQNYTTYFHISIDLDTPISGGIDVIKISLEDENDLYHIQFGKRITHFAYESVYSLGNLSLAQLVSEFNSFLDK
jgi:hypothetical protein